MGWLPLQKGDIVDIVAPGSHCSKEGLDGGIAFLKKWGLVPRMPKKLFDRDVICSNTDENRLAQLKAALTNEDSVAVWCVRGGYGANRLVPELAKLKRPKGPPKLFIGFSDITTIHVFLNEKWGWPTIHGAMLDRIGRGLIDDQQLKELHQIFFGEVDSITYSKLKPMNKAAKTAKTIRGELTGGNAMTLQSSIGTKAPWNTKGKIVFLEEIDERGYRVDRILEHLNQTGHFRSAKAIVLGDFLGGNEPDGTTRVPEVVQRFVESLKIPVLSGIPAGHGDSQRAVPFGTKAILKTGSNGSIEISTGVAEMNLKP